MHLLTLGRLTLLSDSWSQAGEQSVVNLTQIHRNEVQRPLGPYPWDTNHIQFQIRSMGKENTSSRKQRN